MSSFSTWRAAAQLMLLAFATGNIALRGQELEESDTEVITAPDNVVITTSPDLDDVSKSIVDMTNAFRKDQGLAVVEVNSDLDETVEYFARFMATNDKYGHQADEKRPSERADEHGYDYCIVSENIAYQYRSTAFEAKELASGFVEGWKNSPEHRKHMLDADVRDTAVAVAQSKKTGHFYAVQMFGRPRSAAIRFQVANESEVTVHYKLGEKKFALETRYIRTHEQCRPTKLLFLGDKADAKKPVEILQPKSGDAFEIVAGPEQSLSIRPKSE